MAKINNIKKFRQRFVKDYNLPINIFDDNLFEYYIQLYDFFPYLRYKETIEKIENELKTNDNLKNSIDTLRKKINPQG